MNANQENFKPSGPTLWRDRRPGLQLVVLFLPRCCHLYAAQIKTLKTHCGYVPLDPSRTPLDRLTMILRESCALASAPRTAGASSCAARMPGNRRRCRH